MNKPSNFIHFTMFVAFLNSLSNVCVYASIHFYYAQCVCVCACMCMCACVCECVYSFCTFQINYLCFFLFKSLGSVFFEITCSVAPGGHIKVRPVSYKWNHAWHFLRQRSNAELRPSTSTDCNVRDYMHEMCTHTIQMSQSNRLAWN